jgi:Putative esterase
MKQRWGSERRTLKLACAVLLLFPALASAAGPKLQFQISFPASIRAQAVTGRVFVAISPRENPQPILQVGSWGDTPPLFGADVQELKPGQTAILNETTLGYPTASLQDIPAGDYYVQALLNVYTEFHRADGHVVWAHMDHWEGQHFNRSPGNFLSDVRQVHLDPAAGYDIQLTLNQVIPPISLPPDTKWVKRIKIQSALLSHFWGHPIYLGATVLLPEGYASHPGVSYPVVYLQNHFTRRAPFGFTSPEETENPRSSGAELYEAWTSAGFPRVILVTFQHPTPYFDDSYAVNSANNGPYGDAIMNELIPYVETHFRIIRQPYARVLIGGSTGGWEALALQLYHPRFFGGAWVLFPDPVDFRRYGLVNIYGDDNAFYAPGFHWIAPQRFVSRRPDGQPETSVKEFSQLEAVLGSHGRSCQQLEAWDAVFGPEGADGYPTPLWDKRSGEIDHAVAAYMKEHGYDLRAYTAAHWPEIGHDLVGKLHFAVGDMDTYYLNLAVYLFQDYLKTTQDPHYEGSFQYGRPMKGHGWLPAPIPDLIRQMAEAVAKNAPQGADTEAWHY